MSKSNMPPMYSRTGCDTCKRRRKKCDEEQPTCKNCSRLGLSCSYAGGRRAKQDERGYVHLYTLELPSPQLQTRALPITQFEPHEPSVIARVPSSIVRFFTPTTDKAGRDVGGLMQMIICVPVVRNAVVSCFSAILPIHSNQLGHLNRQSLGLALRAVRTQLADLDADVSTLSSLLICIQFLGLIESVGPQQCPDPMTHWNALSTLFGRLAKKNAGSPLPRNVRLLALEATVYHMASFVPFTKDVEVMNSIWQQSDIYNLLIQASPGGRGCIPSSPLMGGQYTLWKLAFEVSSLSRLSATRKISAAAVGQRKNMVRQIQSRLNADYATCQDITPLEQQCMVDIYHLHCTALLIAFTALESATTERTREINRLTADAVQKFVNWHLIPVTYSPAMWGTHILACAISTQQDWEMFNTQITCLKKPMDAGHLRRLESVLAQVTLARATYSDKSGQVNGDDPNTQWPGSLFLLHQPEGLLHDWRVSTRVKDAT